MLELYGKTYAKNDDQMVDSLFSPANGRTCNGYYKKAADGLRLYDMQGKARAFIRKDGLGPVTISETDKGLRYSFGLCSLDAEWLGCDQ